MSDLPVSMAVLHWAIGVGVAVLVWVHRKEIKFDVHIWRNGKGKHE